MKIKEEGTGISHRAKTRISGFFYDISVAINNTKKRLGKKPGKVSVTQLSKEKKRAKRRELLCIWSVLVPPLIGLAVFWVYGTIQSIPIAFEYKSVSGEVAYNFNNFRFIINQFSVGESILPQAFFNTLKYFAFSLFVITPVSYLMAYFLYKKIIGYKFFRFIFFMPTIISSVILAANFKYSVGPQGAVQVILGMLSGNKDILVLNDSRYAFSTMLFYNFYLGLPGDMIIKLAAFSRIPSEVIEAGKIDGLSIFKEIIYLIIPLTMPILGTLILLSFVGILSAGGAALLLTGGGYGTYDLSFYEYLLTVGQTNTENSQGIAGAIGLIKSVLLLPIAFTINKLVNRIEPVEY